MVDLEVLRLTAFELDSKHYFKPMSLFLRWCYPSEPLSEWHIEWRPRVFQWDIPSKPYTERSSIQIFLIFQWCISFGPLAKRRREQTPRIRLWKSHVWTTLRTAHWTTNSINLFCPHGLIKPVKMVLAN
jgi:hypothetical protein